MNADRDKYGILIETYDRNYLGGNINYPKNPQDAYNLLKGWDKNKTFQRNLIKVGNSFNTNGEEEDGDTMLNDGGKPKCTRCGCDNHTVDRCVARRSADGTVLHMMGINEEVDYEVCVPPDEPNSHCGKFETFDYYCGNALEELMFFQPHVYSPVEKPNMILKVA